MYSQGFYNSLAMNPIEVKWARQYISNRAWFHNASVAPDRKWQMENVIFS